MAETLGPYTLERRIGSGGMADIFLARGPDGVCVIKRPHAHLSGSPDFITMFLDEAALLARLSHPGIARVFDLGHQGSTYYLAMEYVPGFDLMTISLEYERQGEWIPPELAARVVSDAAAALHYAHEATGANADPLRIVHRDVTPHNILVSTTGAVKLIDFGVAKAAQSMHRTQAGLVKGKYPYMAPEQVAGKAIDRRVDVYALGLVLYELLANTRAIPGDTEVEQIDNARQSRIKPIEQVRPNVPELLRRILMGCLHPDPEGRYPTALDLHNDLETYMQIERHTVGREDLLRLFRVVAADPTHQLPHAGLPGWDPQGTASDLAARSTTEEVVFPYGAPVSQPALAPSASMVAHGEVPRPVPSPAPVPPSQPGARPAPPPIPLAGVVLHPTEPSMPGPTVQAPKTGAAAPAKDARSGPSLVLVAAAGLLLAVGAALTARVLSNAAKQAGSPPAVAAARPGPAPAAVRPLEVPPVVPAPDPQVAAPEDPKVARPDPPAAPRPPAAAKASLTVASPLEAEITVDGAPLGGLSAELKVGKHTVVLKAKDTGLEHTVTRVLKAGEQWVVAPAAGTLRLELVPFGSARVAGVEVVNGYSTKTIRLWAGSYEVEAENKEAGKSIRRTIEVKAGDEQVASFNFLGP